MFNDEIHIKQKNTAYRFLPAALATLFISCGCLTDTAALPISYSTHGKLLYSTHCVACHIAQENWRDKQVATNWINLRAEVRRWQKISMLESNDDDAGSVASYLNNFNFYCH